MARDDNQPMSLLKDAGQDFLKTIGDKAMTGVSNRVGSLTDRLEGIADGGPVGKAVAKGGEAPAPGAQILVSIFNQGERVDVVGTSKGHGFQGVVKRHHFRGGDATHGSMFHRAPGSIGASSYPSRVLPGMRAHGHMGVDRVTVRNLKVLKVDAENNLLLVKGAVPGAPGGYVVIRKAVAAKPEPKPQLQEKPKKGKK